MRRTKHKVPENKTIPAVFLNKILRLRGRGEIFLVGGAVRDALLGKPSRDFDFAMCVSPARLAGKFSKAVAGSLVTLDDTRKIYRVIKKMPGGALTFDFSVIRGPDIRHDLKQRDITINAMALPLKKAVEYFESAPAAAGANTKLTAAKTAGRAIIARHVIDPTGGISDIAKRSIKYVSETSLREDPVRILRAFRFAAELGFAISRRTSGSASRLRREIVRSAAERIRDEIVKTLETGRSAGTVENLEKTGVLEMVIPEIAAMKKSCKSFYFHTRGLWHHSTETLRRAEEITRSLEKYFPRSAARLSEYLESKISSGSRKALLKFAAALHDAGKPLCAKRIAGRMRFFGHETVGVKVVADIAERLRFSRDEIRFLSILVKNHMRLLQLVGSGAMSDRALYRLARDAGEHLPALTILSLADAASYKNLPGFEKNNVREITTAASDIIKKFFDDKTAGLPPPVINGNILMRRLKIKPGPVVGALLARIEEERAIGKISDTRGAVALAREILKKIAAPDDTFKEKTAGKGEKYAKK